jgi:Icc-related predicted phosphoesterase
MIILHLSDTHGCHHLLRNLPEADVVVHSGDFTMTGSEQEALDFLNWFCDLPYAHKIFICGNHDDCLYGANIDGLDSNVHYLCNSSVEIEGVKFYGVPMFMGDCVTDRQAKNIAKIPGDTDVLVTHCPAYGLLDLDDNINYGDEQLLSKLMQVKPRIHLFGHIHSQHGIMTEHGITFSNGAIMNAGYTTLNLPNVLEI